MRILHIMLRVGDLDRSLHFYCDILGMRLLRRHDVPGGRFTLAFVGYGSEDEEAVLAIRRIDATATGSPVPPPS